MCKRKYLQEHWSLAGHLAAKSPSLWEPTFTPNPVSCLLTHCKSMKNILALWEFYFFQGQGWETFSKYFYMYTTGASASPVCISSKTSFITLQLSLWKNCFNTSHVNPWRINHPHNTRLLPFSLSCTKSSHFYTTAQEKYSTLSLLSFAAQQIARQVRTTQRWLTFGAD